MVKHRVVAVGCLALLAAGTAQAAFDDPAAPGIARGKRIPRFSLPDQNGARQSFESIRGDRGAVIVFYRSADW